MECAKWNGDGMLYMSNELNAAAKDAFEKHMATCECCREELDVYKHEKEHLFTEEILSMSTSEALDKKILEVCMKIPRPAVAATGFFSFARKSVLPFLFLMIGFAGGAYIAFNYQHAQDGAVRMAGQNASDVNASSRISAQQDQDAAVEVLAGASPITGDSLVPDSARSGAASSYDSHRRGNLGRQGVVPVDIQNR